MLFNWKTSYNIISFLTKQPKQWQEYRDILKEGIQKINPKHHIDILINVRLTALNYTFTYIQFLIKNKKIKIIVVYKLHILIFSLCQYPKVNWF